MQIRGSDPSSQSYPDHTVDPIGKGIKELLSFGKTVWLMDISQEFNTLINFLDKYQRDDSLINFLDNYQCHGSYSYALAILKEIYSEMEPQTGGTLESLAIIQKSVLLRLGIIDSHHYGIMPDNTIMDLGYSIYMKLVRLGLFMNRKRNKEDFPFYVSHIDKNVIWLSLDITLL